MSTLAHVLEAAGIATISFASVLGVVEKMKPPRALYCEFPLGRPLGKPNDGEFQTSVLQAGFDLLDSDSQVIATFPEVITSDDTPMACAIPPRFDPDLPAAVDEAQGLRAAYDRALASRGVSAVGRAIDADTIPAALDVFHQVANGATWTDLELPGKNTVAVCHDIRSYYEEAGLELVTGPSPVGRAVEAWFFEETEAGKTIMAARSELQRQEVPFPFWFYMAPGQR